MCTWYSRGLGAGGEQPALVLPGLFSEAWLFSEPGGKGRIAFLAEVSPAEMQECSHAAAGAVAAVPSHRGTAAALALLLRQHGPPSPQTHVWSPQALLRLPWWHALRLQTPLDLSQGSGKRHLVHTSHHHRRR